MNVRGKKALLKSFSYGSGNILTEETLSLFEALATNPNLQISCSLEIIDADKEGRISHDSDFNLLGYDYTVRKIQDKVSKHERLRLQNESEVLFVVNSDDYSKDSILDTVVHEQRYDENYSVCESSLDLDIAKKYLESLNTDISSKDYVNIFKLIKNSLIGFPLAKSKLKSLCDRYKELSDSVYTILSCQDANIRDWLDNMENKQERMG